MKSKDIAYIALKILSICFSMKAINNMTLYLSNKISSHAINSLDSHIEMYSLILTITSIASYLIVGIVLWLKTERISNYIIPKSSYSEKIEMGNSKEFLLDVQVVAFSIVGIVVIMSSLNYIYQYIGSIVMFDNNHAIEGILRTFMVNLGGRVITLILGIILLLKPRKIAKMVRTL